MTVAELIAELERLPSLTRVVIEVDDLDQGNDWYDPATEVREMFEVNKPGSKSWSWSIGAVKGWNRIEHGSTLILRPNVG